jgi:hypothetical protein
MDALRQAGALDEAQITEVLVDTLRSRIGVLFDLRQALQLRDSNTALIVCYGVDDFTWATKEHHGPRTAWTVMSSIVTFHEDVFAVTFRLLPTVDLRLTAHAAAFYVGDVTDLPKAPPDLVDDDDATVARGMPTLASPFGVRHVTTLGSFRKE